MQILLLTPPNETTKKCHDAFGMHLYSVMHKQVMKMVTGDKKKIFANCNFIIIIKQTECNRIEI
jgi:hypothetical protein